MYYEVDGIGSIGVTIDGIQLLTKIHESSYDDTFGDIKGSHYYKDATLSKDIVYY